MKPLTVSELDALVAEAKPYLGLPLQEVVLAGRQVGLGFWAGAGLVWLWCDLSPMCPLFLPIDKPPRLKKQQKPLSLFIKSNVMGKVLFSILRNPSYGRVVDLQLSGDGSETSVVKIEIRLFPHGQNLTVTVGDKQVSLNRPKPLPEGGLTTIEAFEDRSVQQIISQWSEARSQVATDKDLVKSRQQQSEQWLKKRIKKQTTAIAKVEADLQKKRSQPWREMGEWLQAHQSLDVQEDWSSLLDPDKGLHGNIERCFSKAKELTLKMNRTEERLTVMRGELAELESLASEDVARLFRDSQQVGNAKNLLAEASAKGRKMLLDGGMEAFVGKSAQDNLKLLRKARAWDLWLHLKDYPSSHAIIRRNKNQKVSDEQLRQVGQWLLKTSLGAKFSGASEGAVPILVAECRYVRPIKGDRVGRVTYRNERVLSLSLS